MARDASVTLGTVTLKNPVIAGPAEHVLEAAGVRRAIESGVGAVVIKSANEVDDAKGQLEAAEYTLFDEHWRQVPWTPGAPRTATLACRSGLSTLSFDAWLEQAVRMDRVAREHDCLLVASLILANLDAALDMAKQVEAAGLRALEFNIGAPYGGQAKPGNITKETDPQRIPRMVEAVRGATRLPLWVKLTGQSDRVPDLAGSAFGAGADAVILAGRLLGMIPDLDTLKPALDTSLGIGGFWNLPITCHWLAMTRKAAGPGRTLIGINGAQTGEDVARLMLAGATAVEIASPVMVYGFDLLSRAVRDFQAFLDAKGMDARDLIGVAADRHKMFAEMPPRPGNWRNYVTADALGD